MASPLKTPSGTEAEVWPMPAELSQAAFVSIEKHILREAPFLLLILKQMNNPFDICLEEALSNTLFKNRKTAPSKWLVQICGIFTITADELASPLNAPTPLRNLFNKAKQTGGKNEPPPSFDSLSLGSYVTRHLEPFLPTLQTLTDPYIQADRIRHYLTNLAFKDRKTIPLIDEVAKESTPKERKTLTKLKEDITSLGPLRKNLVTLRIESEEPNAEVLSPQEKVLKKEITEITERIAEFKIMYDARKRKLGKREKSLMPTNG